MAASLLAYVEEKYRMLGEKKKVARDVKYMILTF
jgi:hypothetical protein